MLQKLDKGKWLYPGDAVAFHLHHQQYYIGIEYFGHNFQQSGGLFDEPPVVCLKEVAANPASLGWPGSHPLTST